MSNKVYKKIEIVGTSAKSFDEAVKNAIDKASETIRNLDWFEVVEMRGAIVKKKPVFQATLKIGFRLE